MRVLKAFWLRLLAVLGLAAGIPHVALAYDPFVVPTDTAEMFDGFDVLFGNFTLLFGVFVTIAVLITGFILGRRWLSRVG